MRASAPASSRRRPLALWIALLLLGGLAFLVGIGHEGLWYDESFSAAMITHSPGEIWQLASIDQHPPLYYLMLKVFTALFGASEAAMRALSAIGAVLLAGLGLGPVRRIFGAKVGLIYSFLVLITPAALFMAQEARMYTWAALFVTAAAAYAYLAGSGGRRGDWAAFGAFSLAAAYTHHYALMAAGLTHLTLLVWLALRGRERLPAYLLTAGAVALGYLPWLIKLVGQLRQVSQGFWIPPVTGEVIWGTLLYPFGLKFAPGSPPLVAPAAFWITALLTLAALALIARRRPQGGALVVGAALVYALTIAGGVAISYLMRPILVERYMMPVFGLLLLPPAYALGQLPGRAWPAAACALLLGLALPAQAAIRQERFNGPMHEVAAALQGQLQPGDVFLHTSAHTMGTFAYYFPGHRQLLYTNGAASYQPAFEPAAQAGSDLQTLLQGHRRVWLVYRLFVSDKPAPQQCRDTSALKIAGPEQHFQLPRSWYAVAVCPAEPRPPEELARVFAPPAGQGSGGLTVRSATFRDDTGAAIVSLYPSGPLTATNPQAIRRTVPIKAGRAEAEFEKLPYGLYTVSVIHDANSNQQLDTDRFAVFEEGFGLSQAPGPLGEPPSFEMGQFALDRPQTVVDVPVFYYK